MMYVLNAKIKIGAYTFRGVHDIKIKKGIHSYVDTAIIKLPTSARLKRSDLDATESVQVAKQFFEGDPVTISLGYNGQYILEFEGFVKRVDFSTPCQVACEGFSWQLRTIKSGMVKGWKQTSLKEILGFITAGTSVTLSGSIPEMPVEKFYIRSQNGAEVLDMLKERYALTIFFSGRELYAGLAYTVKVDKFTRYKLGWNVIKSDQLRYRRPEDVKVLVEVKYRQPDGKEEVEQYGDKGGQKVQVRLPYIADANRRREIAMKSAEKFRYAGYEGKITTFLIPYCEPGYKAIIDDPRYPERNGDYIIESLEVGYGVSGARRNVEIGVKINPQK